MCCVALRAACRRTARLLVSCVAHRAAGAARVLRAGAARGSGHQWVAQAEVHTALLALGWPCLLVTGVCRRWSTCCVCVCASAVRLQPATLEPASPHSETNSGTQEGLQRTQYLATSRTGNACESEVF